MSKNVYVIAEQRDGKIMKVSYELIGKARELADDLGQEVVAVLMGSGVEAVAGDLAKLGFAITVFDAQAEPGGVLMYGIPAFRLCKDVVRREIQKIQRLGVTFKNNVLIGRDLSLDQLFNQGFDAIFIGTGNSISPIRW